MEFQEERDVIMAPSNGENAAEVDQVSVVRELPTFDNKLYTLAEVTPPCRL